MKLSATGVKALMEPGRYSDGNGLHLFIGRTGNRSWVQRVTVDGRRRDIGLGGYPAVSLKQARRQATLNREAIADGKDPLAERRRSTVPTFREAAQTVHAANRPRWKNHRHAASWLQTLERHAFPKIGNMPVDTIGRADVLAVLTPIWTTTPETARRVRQRMRTVFRWAMAHETMESNPAGEAIDGALPSLPKVKAHLRALPYRETGEALRTVDASQASPASKLCLRFLVLTAARSGEARGASWEEIDTDGAVWTVPGSRMKAGGEHRVPLSTQALEVFEAAHRLRDGSQLCFPVVPEAGTYAERQDSDECAPKDRARGTDDGARFQDVVPDMDDGADGYVLGGRRGGPGSPARRRRGPGLCPLRPVRAAPHADAAMGGLPHGAVRERRLIRAPAMPKPTVGPVPATCWHESRRPGSKSGAERSGGDQGQSHVAVSASGCQWR